MEFPREKIVLVLLGLLLGLGIGYFTLPSSQGNKESQQALSQVHSIRENNPTYKFINPLLAYDLPESKDFDELAPLEEKFSDIINKEKSAGRATDVAVYYRSGGHWVGINEDEHYDPASLLKIVVMIAYYKQAEQDPNILNRQILYSTQIKQLVQNTNTFDSPSQLKLGKSYTIDDLINRMIEDSDNGAAFALLGQIDNKYLNDVYTDLSLNAPNDNGEYTISAKDYSLFFRILYNATYLNREMSEKAMTLLSKTTFKNGLVAGVGAGTTVVHKYGEHVVGQDGQISEVQLHDCGLIYTKTPYLLCVMTKGKDIAELENIIKDISSVAYQEAK